MPLVSPAVRAERARLRAFLEDLNRQSQEPRRDWRKETYETECSICRAVHPNDDRHASE